MPEVASALESFAADLPTSRAQEVVRTNFSLIAQVYECSKYKNLRLVRHALWEFDRLTQSLEKSALHSDPLLADLLALFLAYSFEVHSGTVKTTDVRKLHNTSPRYSINNPNEADPDQRFQDIRAKYSGLNLYTFLLTDPVCEAIFSTGSIPKADLNESLLRSKYFQSENQPNWVKLWYGANLSDDEFDRIFSIVQTEWSSRVYRQLGEVIHVTGLFVRFAKHGIYDATAEEVIESAKYYIDYLLESGDIPRLQPNSRPSPFEQDAYAGLGYTSLQEKPFKEFLQYIDEQRRSDLSASLPEDASKLLELIGTDTNLFYRRIILNNNSDNIYYETPILHLIEPNKFLDYLLRAKSEERRVVAIAIKERYRIEQFNIKLLPELDWLRTIVGLLREEITRRTGKVSSLSIKQLVDSYLADAIAQLEKTKPPHQCDSLN